MNNFKILSFLSIFTFLAPQLAFSEKFRVVSVNIGAACAGIDTLNQSQIECPSSDPQNNDVVVVGLRRQFGSLAVNTHDDSIDELMFTLQEVDIATTRNPNWDMPAYFKNKLNSYMSDNGITEWNWSEYFSGENLVGGEYGLATLTSNSPRKTSTYYFETVGDNSIFQSTKISVGDEWFWVINLHLNKNPLIAQRQLDEVLKYTQTLDHIPNIILTGDFNIWRDGYHKNICPYKCSLEEQGYSPDCEDHKAAYRVMHRELENRGFEEVGAFDGACWQQMDNECSFKATGQNYSRMDYVFLLKRNPNINASVSLQRMEVDDLILTDHYAMIVDLSW